MSTISIIIPSYNTEKYLLDCLYSIDAQLFNDYEVVLIDDGSFDGSGTLCDEYVLSHNCTVLHQHNNGQATARNHGIQVSIGQYICFVDADDTVDSHLLSRLYCAIQTTENELAFCSYADGQEIEFTVTDEPAHEFQNTEEELLYLYHNRTAYWVPCGKLISRDLLLTYPFTEGMFYEDNAVVCKWLYAAGRCCEIPDKLYYYRTNPESTTQKKFTARRFDYLWALEEQLRFFESVEYRIMCQTILTGYFNAVEILSTQAMEAKVNRFEIITIIRKGWLLFFKKQKYIQKPLTVFKKLFTLYNHVHRE